MAFDLVDSDSGNYVGHFRSKEAAFRSIRATLATAARGRIKDFALYDDDSGLVAKGAKLAELAQSAGQRKTA